MNDCIDSYTESYSKLCLAGLQKRVNCVNCAYQFPNKLNFFYRIARSI